MSRLDAALAPVRAGERVALVPFLTAGDPSLEATVELVKAAEDAGADVIELGVPFSDPLADGPSIQASSARALASGTTLRGILGMVERLRSQVHVPLVCMGYANPIRAMGAEAFARAAAAAGVDGVIVPDLPADDGEEIFAPLRAAGVDTILLVTPTTPAARVKRIGRSSRGFLYYVSLTGVTGARAQLASDLGARIRAVKRNVELPVFVGFGISTPEHAARVARVADGVIVGSAVVDRVPGPGGVRGACKRVFGFVAALRAAIDGAR